MFGDHSKRIVLASVTLACVAVILQGCQKQQPSGPSEAAKPQAKPESQVAAPPPAPAAPPVWSGVFSNIPTAQAAQHIGETNRVCGVVASTRFLESGRNQPTYLNFDHPYPDQTFTVLIHGPDRAKFKTPPEVMFNQKTVCVTGVILDYRGKPEIVVEDPAQIVIQEAAATNASPDQVGASATVTNANQQTPAAAGVTTTSPSQTPPTTTSPP